MRKLFILYGPQGAGKTTFVQENKLDEFSVSADEVRRMFSRYVPALDGDKVLIAGEHLQRLTRRIVQEQADNLMFLGSPVIIDAVNASPRSRSQWEALADSHGYDVLAVDFTQVSREELLSRNLKRGGTGFPILSHSWIASIPFRRRRLSLRRRCWIVLKLARLTWAIGRYEWLVMYSPAGAP